MLHIVTWIWGTKWPPYYAERLFAGIKRNLKQPVQLVLMSDKLNRNGADAVHLIDEVDSQYLALPGCLVRMRMFDRNWQEKIGAEPCDRIVNIDIDCVITGSINHLFNKNDEFTITQHYNSTNPCPFNGSLWMFRAGERQDVWDDFSLDVSRSSMFRFTRSLMIKGGYTSSSRRPRLTRHKTAFTASRKRPGRKVSNFRKVLASLHFRAETLLNIKS